MGDRSPPSPASTSTNADAWLASLSSSSPSMTRMSTIAAPCRRAVIVREPADSPWGRCYSDADPEGHRWPIVWRAPNT